MCAGRCRWAQPHVTKKLTGSLKGGLKAADRYEFQTRMKLKGSSVQAVKSVPHAVKFRILNILSSSPKANRKIHNTW
jgi:hypothetical protein